MTKYTIIFLNVQNFPKNTLFSKRNFVPRNNTKNLLEYSKKHYAFSKMESSKLINFIYLWADIHPRIIITTTMVLTDLPIKILSK
jgi:hypothetical protein